MKLKKNSLHSKIWIYLIVFSIIILGFLWLFQVIFLNKFYEWHKERNLITATSKIIDIYNNSNSTDDYNTIAHEYGICLEIDAKYNTLFASTSFNKGCMVNNMKTVNAYKSSFISSNADNQKFIIINPMFNNKTLIYAINLDNNVYLYVSASLEPLDATIVILKDQLIIVSIVVLILSFLIAYYISKYISKPIEIINDTAKQISKGNFVTFDTKTDIEEIKELTSTLNYANKELEKTDQLRRDLLANVSHDLKTPLTMIKAYAEMVRDLTYKNKEKRNNNLNVIIDETDRLNHLVEDILILSKVQSKTIELNIETFNLNDMINEIIKRYNILKETEGYNFIYSNTDDIYVYADKKRIEQVIYNLVNNAINYTGVDKNVTIKIINEANIRIEIIDTGKGIDEKDIPYIWDKYYHTDKNHQRNIIGTGLGLSIVKNILDMHNFKYGVISKKHKGTTFYFEIPKTQK